MGEDPRRDPRHDGGGAALRDSRRRSAHRPPHRTATATAPACRKVPSGGGAPRCRNRLVESRRRVVLLLVQQLPAIPHGPGSRRKGALGVDDAASLRCCIRHSDRGNCLPQLATLVPGMCRIEAEPTEPVPGEERTGSHEPVGVEHAIVLDAGAWTVAPNHTAMDTETLQAPQAATFTAARDSTSAGPSRRTSMPGVTTGGRCVVRHILNVPRASPVRPRAEIHPASSGGRAAESPRCGSAVARGPRRKSRSSPGPRGEPGRPPPGPAPC